MNVKVYVFFLQIKELGKQRLQLEVSGRIQTPSPQEEDDEDMWLTCDSRSTSPGRTLYRSLSWLK
jgi:hypothetical protein